jgi:lipoprotein
VKKLFALFTVLLLAACSKGYERYEGYWKMENVSFQYLIQIQKADESTYLLKDDVLGGSDSSRTLEQQDKGVLALAGGEALELSDDGATLKMGKAAYRRIDDAEAAALQQAAQQEIAKQKAVQVENLRRCQENSAAYQKEKAALRQGRGAAAKNEAALSVEYRRRALKIPGCHLAAD